MSHPAPPPLSHSLSDLPRSALETARLAIGLRDLVARAPRGDGGTVLALPGYGGGDATTAVLRHFLGRVGYRTKKLGLGVNVESAEQRIQSVDDAVRFREQMGEQVRARVHALTDRTGERLNLVGWSMGGLYAFDAARALPDRIRMVVTLGSPYGDPRGTALFSLLRRLSGSNVPIASQDFGAWLDKRGLPVDAPPVKILYSPRDGIVSTDVARVPDHPAVALVPVDSSHIGFGVNPDALSAVAEQLATPTAA